MVVRDISGKKNMYRLRFLTSFTSRVSRCTFLTRPLPHGRGSARWRGCRLASFDYGDNFIANKMEPDDLEGLTFFEVTTNRITHHLREFCDGVCFGKNGVPKCSSGVSTFRSFFDVETRQFRLPPALSSIKVDIS